MPVAAPIDVDDLYSKPAPPFGHELLPYFGFDKGYVNLNHGSYGSAPLPVLKAAIDLLHEAEANPDKFHRLSYQAKMTASRTALAKLVNAHPDEIVLVPNTTTGVNTVLRNFEWEKGDVIFTFTTTYYSSDTTVTYISEIPPYPTKSVIHLQFPTTKDQILEQFKAHLKSPEAQAAGKNNKRVAVIDSLASNPGLLLPWKEMVQICKDEGVWSVIDAAHSLGQEVDIDLSEVQPDFWVSNAHKWLFVKRSCTALYIPFRNQHIIKTSLPTSNFYKPLTKRNGDPNLQIQFEWTGTLDYGPYLVVPDALRFRAWLGGEHAINTYCRQLALDGGKLLAELWGTSLMDPSGSMTLNMVNVELPLPLELVGEAAKWSSLINEKLINEFSCYSAWFVHNGRWWTRCSAQVFNDISDFEKLGQAWLEIAKEIKEEKKKGEESNA